MCGFYNALIGCCVVLSMVAGALTGCGEQQETAAPLVSPPADATPADDVSGGSTDGSPDGTTDDSSGGHHHGSVDDDASSGSTDGSPDGTTEVELIAPTDEDYPLTTCIITGESFTVEGKMKMVAVRYAGREVRFCCKSCVKKFKRDPSKYLAVLDDAGKGDTDHTDHTDHADHADHADDPGHY